MGSCAITVQCFIKADTLEALCESLIKCDRRDEFELIFWSDSPRAAKGRTSIAGRTRRCSASSRISAKATAPTSGTSRSTRTRRTLAPARPASSHGLRVPEERLRRLHRGRHGLRADFLAWLLGMRDAGVMDRPDVVALAGEFDTSSTRGGTPSPPVTRRARARPPCPAATRTSSPPSTSSRPPASPPPEPSGTSSGRSGASPMAMRTCAGFARRRRSSAPSRSWAA